MKKFPSEPTADDAIRAVVDILFDGILLMLLSLAVAVLTGSTFAQALAAMFILRVFIAFLRGGL